MLRGAKSQRLEVVRGRSEFRSHLSIPQANPTQPVTPSRLIELPETNSGFLDAAGSCDRKNTIRRMKFTTRTVLELITAISQNMKMAISARFRELIW